MRTIAAGVFVRGSAIGDPRAFPVEFAKCRLVDLPAFNIGQYPVTNAEYGRFIEASGYEDERWWTAEGRNWRTEAVLAVSEPEKDWLGTRNDLRSWHLKRAAAERRWSAVQLRFWRDSVRLSDEIAKETADKRFRRSLNQPAFWNENPFNQRLQPVVGVSWYEAEAYANWLSGVTGRSYRLPNELEWEKAARGPSGREYPWGERFETTRANTAESNLGRPTRVGMYPDGISEYGLFDASGNVFEWTADWFQAYPSGDSLASSDYGERFRVVRGGSWRRTCEFARCAFRQRDIPAFFFANVGFRLAMDD